MKKIFLSVPLFIIIGIFSNTAEASVLLSDSITCTQKLNKAKKVYDSGKISEVESYLTACIEEGFSKEEKMQALRLLILSFLFQDDHDRAEANLLLLLKEDPEYQLNPAIDPAEFYELYNSYRTLPLINIGLIGGVNFASVKELESYSLGGNPDNKPNYKSRLGYQGGLVADILLKNAFQIHTGGIFSFKNFTYTNKFLFDDATTITSQENQFWLDVPLALKYNLGKKKFRIYAMAGGNFSLLMTSNSKLSRENSNGEIPAKEDNVSFKEIRDPYTYSALAGLGLRYKVGYGYIFVDARYTMGLKNVANVKNRYYTEDGDNLFYFGYVSSDFLVNNLAFSVGYMKSFYKPKKIRQIGE